MIGNVPTLKKGQLAYLLRVGSEDAAVIVGSWSGFEKPASKRSWGCRSLSLFKLMGVLDMFG